MFNAVVSRRNLACGELEACLLSSEEKQWRKDVICEDDVMDMVVQIRDLKQHIHAELSKAVEARDLSWTPRVQV